MNFEMVIFDMAGTTVDEDNVVYKTLQMALSSEGYSCSLDLVLSKGGGKEKLQALKDILIELKVDQSNLDQIAENAFSFFKEKLVENYHKLEVKPCAGAIKVFHHLQKNGIKIVLNTGYSKEIALLLINKLNWKIGKDFDLLITSSDVLRSRPFPDMIYLAMEKLGISDSLKVIKIGDTAIDIEEGKNANCGLCLGITSGAQSREEIENSQPDGILNHLIELLEYIQKPINFQHNGNPFN